MKPSAPSPMGGTMTRLSGRPIIAVPVVHPRLGASSAGANQIAAPPEMTHHSATPPATPETRGFT